MKKKRTVITWRQIRKNGYFESGVIYNNKPACDEIVFRWIIDDKVKWHYELTVGEAMQMIRGIASALYYKLEKETVKKFGKLLSRKNPL